jgi:centrosomal protein CEP76
MYENLHKEKQSRNSASKGEQPTSKPEPHSDEINLLKPNFMKKKDKPNKTEEE